MKTPLMFSISYKETRGVAISGGDFRTRGVPWGIPEHPVGILDVSTGGDYKRWPDMMKCGSTVPDVVSEKVINDLRQAGIPFEAGPTELHCAEGPVTPPPNYFYLCAPIGIELDETHQVGLTFPVKPETWTGLDFCRSENRPKLAFCSFRVIEAARKGKWTNFSFRLPPGILTDVPNPIRDVDYLALKRDWPPVWLRELLEKS